MQNVDQFEEEQKVLLIQSPGKTVITFNWRNSTDSWTQENRSVCDWSSTSSFHPGPESA